MEKSLNFTEFDEINFHFTIEKEEMSQKESVNTKLNKIFRSSKKAKLIF